jgi:hypothetical protein
MAKAQIQDIQKFVINEDFLDQLDKGSDQVRDIFGEDEVATE